METDVSQNPMQGTGKACSGLLANQSMQKGKRQHFSQHIPEHDQNI